MEYVPNIGIAIVLFILSEAAKKTVLKNNADLKALLPYICALLGAVAAVICFVIDPSMLEGVNNVLDAVVAGAISGLSATGAHQLYKQSVKLATVSRSISAEVTEEVKDMTSEEKKDYITDIATDMLSSVLKKTQNELNSSNSNSTNTDNSSN